MVAIACGAGIGYGVGRLVPKHDGWPVKGERIRTCAPGPWGHLWYVPSVIELPPDRIKVDSAAAPAEEWYMEARSSDDLANSLKRCGLTPHQIQQLLAWQVGTTNRGVFIFEPADSFIVGLTEEQRASLYDFLGQYPQNAPQYSPFRFSDSALTWLMDADLDPGELELVRTLLYRHGKTMMFADLAVVLHRYPSVDAYARLLRILSREATLLLRLRILPEDDTEALVRYWGAPDRDDEIRARFNLVKESKVLHDIQITALLPLFVRDRLYRYLRPEDPAFPSCHYTTMNFFNREPDARFTNLVVAAETLKRDYVEITGAPMKLGDVILLMRNTTDVIHSCNYIADDIVFSRNGGSVAQPWILTKLSPLVGLYSYPEPVRVKVMRRRDLMNR